jgi:hypothetical protein
MYNLHSGCILDVTFVMQGKLLSVVTNNHKRFRGFRSFYRICNFGFRGLTAVEIRNPNVTHK